MATAVLLYNGLHFPLAIIDKSIAWAAAAGGNIIVLCVLSDRDQDEGYPFPNDLDAEDITTDTDAMGTDLAIIASNIRLMQRQATIAGVALRAHILADTSREEIHTWLIKADKVFVSEEPLDPPVLSVSPSKIKTVLAGITATIEWVK